MNALPQILEDIHRTLFDGAPSPVIVLVGKETADAIHKAMVEYYEDKSGKGSLRIIQNSNINPPEGDLRWRTYSLFYPAGASVTVATHVRFEEWAGERKAA